MITFLHYYCSIYTVDSLKNHLIHSTRVDRGYKTETISMAGLYRRAQKEGIESTMIWLISKLNTVSDNIPNGMDGEQAQRKLMKIIAGVIMHVTYDMSDEISPKERAVKIDEAILRTVG